MKRPANTTNRMSAQRVFGRLIAGLVTMMLVVFFPLAGPRILVDCASATEQPVESRPKVEEIVLTRSSDFHIRSRRQVALSKPIHAGEKIDVPPHAWRFARGGWLRVDLRAPLLC